jgi:DNA-binding transcriptional MerR regulator
MTEELLYQIGELAEQTGVTPRTIRYYTAEGLLPPPDTRGRYALYGENHALRLQLINRLKEAYLPLNEIKLRIEQLTIEQVRRLLAEYDRAPEPQSPSSAADYVAQALAGQRLPPARKLAEATPYYDVNPAGAAEFQASAASAKSQAQPQEPAHSVAPPAPLQVGAVGPLVPAPAPPAPATPGQRSLLGRLIPQRRERAAAPAPPAQEAAAQTWRRVPLAPGVELHVREPVEPGLRERVERMIEVVRGLFEEDQDV